MTGLLPDDPIDATLEATLGRLHHTSSNTELEGALLDFGTRAATLTPVQRKIARIVAIKELKTLGIDGPAGLVDSALVTAMPTEGADSGGSGSSVVLKDTEPWPDPVDGFALLDEITATIQRYLAMPNRAALTAALWAVLTHVHDAFHVSPILAVTSPQKRCGKSTLLLVLQALVRRPLPAASITAASLFRTVEKYKPTLLVDEADTFLNNSDDLRGILNSGHLRASAQVIRSVGDDFEPRVFSTWAPKAIALIGRLPDTLEDRSILIPLRRRAPGEHIERLRLDRLWLELEPLRRKLARWGADNLDALTAVDPDVPAELHDRAADNWRPLLAIADVADSAVGGLARKAAVVVSKGVADDDAPPAELLLGDIRHLYDERHADRLMSEDIVESLVAIEDHPWPEWRRGRPLSKRGLARLLAPFGIRPKKVRIGDITARG